MTRKILSLAVVLCLVLSLHAGIAAGADKEQYKRIGDFDGDGEITVADALAVLRIAAKLESRDSCDSVIADVTGDGSVMIDDALAILRCSAGLSDGFGYAGVEIDPVPNASAVENGVTPHHLDEAIMNTGNTAGMVKAMQKAQRGEPVTVAVIGGSITAGSAAETPDKCYGAITAQWWRDSFPQSQVTYINKGIHATTSALGVHRLEQDILVNDPDFIIVEFAVNDDNTPYYTESYENIIRRLRKHNPLMGIMSLFMSTESGWNCQESESPMLTQYDIPQISYRNVIWDMMTNDKSIVWGDISPDDIHPNTRGHAIAGSLITSFLDAVKEKMDVLSVVPPSMPEPVYGEKYMNATLYMGGSIEPDSMGDWEPENFALLYLSGAWKTTKKGKPITFTVKAHDVSVGYLKTTTKSQSGTVKVVVDGIETASLNSFFEDGWGGYMAIESVFSEDKSEEHVFQFICVDGMFTLCALMISE